MRTRRQRSSSDPVPERHRSTHTKSVSEHLPVLLHESLEALDIQKGDIVLDATLGGAGHAKELLSRLGPKGTLVGIDADPAAIARAKEKLAGAKAKVILVEGNFKNLESYLGKHVIPHLDKAFFDLGWSSYQLSAGRGFSFLADEPLLMTYSQGAGENGVTAGTIVNDWAEESIADVIYGWGEERYSRRIARAIVEARKTKRIETSRELGEIIRSAVPLTYRKGALHPATRSFQALRIATNDEMGSLKKGLHAAWNSLNSGGRLAVISFHSVEDREVKRLMRAWAESEGRLLFKKPIVASEEEVRGNPRARSAKLRCIEKY